MTQRFQHTPEPWLIVQPQNDENTSDYIEIHDPFGRTATIYGDDGEAQANARLITAAPNMLILLKELNYAFYVKGTRKALLEVMAKTRPLIAKIEAEPDEASDL
jgi:hypothetical protein